MDAAIKNRQVAVDAAQKLTGTDVSTIAPAGSIRRSRAVVDQFFPPCPVRARWKGTGPFLRAKMVRLSEDGRTCDVGFETARFLGISSLPHNPNSVFNPKP